MEYDDADYYANQTVGQIIWDYMNACLLFVQFKYIINPDTRGKAIWDWTMIMLTLYSLVVIPWNAGFDPLGADDMVGFDYFVNAFFLIDVWINFRTATKDYAGRYVFDTRLIARKYLKNGFVLDLLAAFPFELVMTSAFVTTPEGAPTYLADYAQVNKLWKLPGIFRGFRLAYSPRLDALASPFSRILKLLVGFLLLAHFNCTIFFYVGKTQPAAATDSWVAKEGESLGQLLLCMCTFALVCLFVSFCTL